MSNIAAMRSVIRGTTLSQSYLNEAISPMACASALTESFNDAIIEDYTMLSECAMELMLNEHADPIALTESVIDSIWSGIKKIWDRIVSSAKGVVAWIKEQIDKMRLSGQQLANNSAYVTKAKGKALKGFTFEGFDFKDVTFKVTEFDTFIEKKFPNNAPTTLGVKVSDAAEEVDKKIAAFRKDHIDKITDASSEIATLKTEYFKSVTGITAGGEKMESSKMNEELYKLLRNGKSTKIELKNISIDTIITRLKTPADLQEIQDEYQKVADSVEEIRDAFERQAKEITDKNDANTAPNTIKVRNVKADYLRKLSSIYESVLSTAALITNAKVQAAKDRIKQDTDIFKAVLAYKEVKKDNNSFAFEEDDNEFLAELDILSAE